MSCQGCKSDDAPCLGCGRDSGCTCNAGLKEYLKKSAGLGQLPPLIEKCEDVPGYKKPEYKSTCPCRDETSECVEMEFECCCDCGRQSYTKCQDDCGSFEPSIGCSKCRPIPETEECCDCKPSWVECPPSESKKYPEPENVKVLPISQGGRKPECAPKFMISDYPIMQSKENKGTKSYDGIISTFQSIIESGREAYKNLKEECEACEEKLGMRKQCPCPSQASQEEVCGREPPIPESKPCKPMPETDYGGCCTPEWVKCPPTLNTKPYEAPEGACITPISAGGFNTPCRNSRDINCNIEEDECGCEVQEESCEENINDFYYQEDDCCCEEQQNDVGPCEESIGEPKLEEEDCDCCCCCCCPEEEEVVAAKPIEIEEEKEVEISLDCSCEVVQRLENCIKDKLKECIEETLKENFCMKVQEENCGCMSDTQIPMDEKEPELLAGIAEGDPDVNGGSDDDYGLEEPQDKDSIPNQSGSTNSMNNNNSSDGYFSASENECK